MLDFPTKVDHYGYRYLTPIKDLWRRGFHPGEDGNYGVTANADLGQPVYSFGNGRVVFASSFITPGWGKLIVIEHKFKNAKGEPVTVWGRYAHLNTVGVKVGDWVTEKTQIASLGKTGTKYAHLHFDIMKESPLGKYYQYIWGWTRTQVAHKYADIDWIRNNWTHI